MKIAILGGGPCGLGAAYRLMECDHRDWHLYERNTHVGGLSASYRDVQGFTWDVGGHVLFSHYDYFDRVVEKALQGQYLEHQRESWIRIADTWVPYPFQNNIHRLPGPMLEECLSGLRHLQDNSAALNFHEWMRSVFGEGIVKYFMEPYNRKVWGVSLDAMSKDWIHERVSVVDLGRIEKNIREQRDDVSWGPNNKFKFPKHGGTGAIFESIARRFPANISYKKTAERIDLARRIIAFSDGTHATYDVVVNTTPLDIFVKACNPVPGRVADAAHDLLHNSGFIVGLGFAGSRIDPKCWMYFPEGNAPFYRTTNFFNYSPHNVPGGKIDRYFSLMCETTYSAHKEVVNTEIIEDSIQGLVNSGLITDQERANIVTQYLLDVPYSYPVPTLQRDRALSVIQPYLENNGIYSRGRFGAWKYEVGNMDHSFMQGVEVIDRILQGKAESTINGRV